MKGSKGYIRKVIELLTGAERRRLVAVMLGAIFATLVEAVGIGSVMPFVAVASKPAIIHSNHYLSWAYDLLGFGKEASFLIFLGLGVLGMLIVTNVGQAALHYFKVRFTSMRRHSLSMRLLTGYLRQPYVYFLNKNSFDFVKNINTEIGQMINLVLIQFVELLSRAIQVTLLALFLFLVNPTSTLIVAAAIIGVYGAIYLVVKKALRRMGSERFELNAERSRIVSEAVWGIKEVKIAGNESTFLTEFKKPSLRLAKVETNSTIISDIPRFALETAAFSAIVGYILVMILRSGSFQDVAGAITLFAYAGYRIIPAIQAMFRAFAQLRFGAATADKLAKEFAETADGAGLARNKAPRMPLRSTLGLKDICFTYPGVPTPVISGITLQIAANSLIGLAGRTGSGKTTLVDIILGLLRIQGGTILIDGEPLLSDNLRNWQANLGYVPQNIFLSNDTIAANIAFGVARKDIDMQAVLRAAQLSQLHEFVENELKEKYETRIGERGIRLSGGQRQRIGIARALYQDPSVLILDEATSALDSHTEKAVIEAIDTLQGTRTIIMIAHRLTTLKRCDVIYLMEKGRIVDSGSYDELRERSNYFLG